VVGQSITALLPPCVTLKLIVGAALTSLERQCSEPKDSDAGHERHAMARAIGQIKRLFSAGILQIADTQAFRSAAPGSDTFSRSSSKE